MEHGAVVDRARQIGRIAAARREADIVSADHAALVEADLVVGAEVVALAGHHHVVVAVEPHLARPAGHARGERGDRGPLRGLRLLAAEAAAHAPHLDRHRGDRHVEHVRDEMLQLARMLARRVDHHVVLARNGERYLAFEIELLLSADADRAREPVRACRKRGRAVLRGEDVIRQHVGVGCQRVVDRDERRLRFHLDSWRAAPPAAHLAGLRHHGEHDLIVEFDGLVGEDRVVVQHRPDIVLAGNIGRGQHQHDAGRGAHRVEIDRLEPPPRDRRAAERDMQRPLRLADVVDIGCRAADVPDRGIVRRRRADDAQRRRFQFGGITERPHGRPPGCRPRGCAGWAFRQSRSAPCAAASRRSCGDNRRWRAGP